MRPCFMLMKTKLICGTVLPALAHVCKAGMQLQPHWPGMLPCTAVSSIQQPSECRTR